MSRPEGEVMFVLDHGARDEILDAFRRRCQQDEKFRREALLRARFRATIAREMAREREVW